MKLYIYITNPVDFLTGNLDNCLAISPVAPDITRLRGGEWPFVGVVDVDINADLKELTQIATTAIEKKEKEEVAEHEYKMKILREEKQKVLAIEHKPEL